MNPKVVHAATLREGLWTPKCADSPGWSAPLAEISGQVTCLECVGLIVKERLQRDD